MTILLKKFRELSHTQEQLSAIHLPEMLHLKNKTDRKRFDEILELPALIFNDQIVSQVAEYLKCTHPSQRLGSAELESMAIARLGDKPEEYGVWAFYPWSRRLVHLLPEEEFIHVRTSRNQYKIAPREREILAGKKIGVIGLSVGQSVSVTLAMERICGELRLADFDRLELTNLNRIRTGVHNLGLHKVYSVAREIAEIDPYLKVTCFPKGLTEENMDEFFSKDGRLDLLVEESDGFDIKILSRYKARELGIPVLMEASDRCMVDVERFDREPERPILHGIVKNLDIDTLKSLTTTEEKIPYMLDVLGFGSTSARLRASMLEINKTVTTWPQLASAVTMGGGITADVARRLLLDQFTDSGRYYVDVEELIGPRKEKDSSPAQKNAEKTPAYVASIMHEASLRAAAMRCVYWKWTMQGEAVKVQAIPRDAKGARLVQLHLVCRFISEAAAASGYRAQIKTGEDEASATVELVRSETHAQPAAAAQDSLAALKAELDRMAARMKMKLRFLDKEAVNLYAKAEGSAMLAGFIHPRLSRNYQAIVSGLREDEKLALFSAMGAAPALAGALDVLSDPAVAKLVSEWNTGSTVRDYFTEDFRNAEAAAVINGGAGAMEIAECLAEMQRVAVASGYTLQQACGVLDTFMQLDEDIAEPVPDLRNALAVTGEASAAPVFVFTIRRSKIDSPESINFKL